MNMKFRRTVPLALLCIMLLSGCTGERNEPQNTKPAAGLRDEPKTASKTETQTEKEAYHKITAEEAKDMMANGNVIVVDVRTPEEYDEAHIAKAISIPNETISDEMPELLPDQKAMLIVYCRTGVRSRQAADRLVALGYKNVYDMGGIVDWNYETESGAADEQ